MRTVTDAVEEVRRVPSGRRSAIRTAATAAVFALFATVPIGAATADPTPTAGQVAAARAAARGVAAQVGVMQAELAAAQAKLLALGQAVDAASEVYDGAMYKLGQAQQAAAAASSAAANAQTQVDAARQDLGRMAAAAYRGDGLGMGLGAVIAADSPSSVLEAVSTMSVLASRQNAVVDRVRATRVVAGVLDRQAVQALNAVAQAAAAAQAARTAVLARVAAQTAQVAALNAQVASLSKALAAATARSRSLTRARQVGLARAAAQRRAQALARARAAGQASRGSNGSGGNDTSGHPGTPQGTSAGAAAAVAFARAQLGKPYQWGGAGPDTFDCSGLTMRAWEAGGVQLAHWTVAQWQESTPIPASQARPGDLVFYAYNLNDFTTIHHVALYIGNGMIIEAPFTGADVRISYADRPDLFGYGRP